MTKLTLSNEQNTRYDPQLYFFIRSAAVEAEGEMFAGLGLVTGSYGQT